MKRLIIAMALCAGVLGAVGATPASAAPVTTTTVVANHLAATPAVVVAEARKVRVPADLARVSPAAAAYVTTVVKEVKTTTYGVTGAFNYYGQGCHTAIQINNHVNIYGWVLTSSQTRINNWCTNGRVITSVPWYQTIENAHWGYVFCGLTNGFGGWFGRPNEWGAGASFNYGIGACSAIGLRDSPVVFVYGNGTETGF